MSILETGPTGERLPEREPIEPEDWPTEPERGYARAQATLLEHYDVDAVSKAVETDVMGRVHYLEAGDSGAEPIVLLHGVGTTAGLFAKLLGDLADDYRVIAPDRPGRGLSANASYAGMDVRDSLVVYLLETLDALDLERPHVVGNSLGGLQAFLLTIDHDRVDHLGLVAAPGGLSADFPLAFKLMTMKGVNRLIYWLMRRGDPLANAREQTEEMLLEDTSEVPEAFYQAFAASRGIPGRQRSLRSLVEQEASFGRLHHVFEMPEEIAAIDRPTRFVWGEEDFFWGPEVGRPVIERMADADLVALADHGHMPWMEPGDEVATALRDFLPS